MIEAQWHGYNTRNALAAAVAERIGNLIADAVNTRGEAFVALTGGKSPIPVFERLAAPEIDWSAAYSFNRHPPALLQSLPGSFDKDVVHHIEHADFSRL